MDSVIMNRMNKPNCVILISSFLCTSCHLDASRSDLVDTAAIRNGNCDKHISAIRNGNCDTHIAAGRVVSFSLHLEFLMWFDHLIC